MNGLCPEGTLPTRIQKLKFPLEDEINISRSKFDLQCYEQKEFTFEPTILDVRTFSRCQIKEESDGKNTIHEIYDSLKKGESGHLLTNEEEKAQLTQCSDKVKCNFWDYRELMNNINQKTILFDSAFEQIIIINQILMRSLTDEYRNSLLKFMEEHPILVEKELTLLEERINIINDAEREKKDENIFIPMIEEIFRIRFGVYIAWNSKDMKKMWCITCPNNKKLTRYFPRVIHRHKIEGMREDKVILSNPQRGAEESDSWWYPFEHNYNSLRRIVTELRIFETILQTHYESKS